MANRLQPSLDSSLSRRAVMASVVSLSGGALLTACGGSSSSGSASSGAPTTSSTGAPTPSSPSAGSVSPPAGASAIVALTAVPVGGSVSAQLNGKPIIVGQPTAGKVVAFTAICTHKGCTVEPAGATLNCPCHGSVYNALTGQNISGPAPLPLAAIPVTVSNGNIIPT